jgi:hypothetical protein
VCFVDFRKLDVHAAEADAGPTADRILNG